MEARLVRPRLLLTVGAVTTPPVQPLPLNRGGGYDPYDVTVPAATAADDDKLSPEERKEVQDRRRLS